MTRKPCLLILSHVLPFPGKSGQQQRVFYTLKATRKDFHVTFVSFIDSDARRDAYKRLSLLCDDAVLLPSRASRSKLREMKHRIGGTLYSLRTGLKASNYIIGQVELAPARLASLLLGRRVDCCLFEYWHAVASIPVLHANGVPCVLDMHNILWQSYARQLSTRSGVPRWWRRWALKEYKIREEQGWRQFDGLIAINAEEKQYVRSVVSDNIPVFYVPMGVDLNQWPYSWQPAYPPRVAYYGALNSPHNQREAHRCYEDIMPEIWRDHPNAELWLVGSQPAKSLQALSEKDERVKVTGYVKVVQEVLRKVLVVVCPWSGTYGFRSRLVEVMALGVPVVASPEAIYGMELRVGCGVFVKETPQQMARVCSRLIGNLELASQQSRLARDQVEEKYSYESTYGQLAVDLLEFTVRRRGRSNPDESIQMPL